MADKLTVTMTIGSLAATGEIARTKTGNTSISETIAAAKSGTLSTRTDNDTGVVTSASHGWTDGTYAVFWATGSRYGMTLSSYDTNTLTIDGGTGDNLPTQSTAVTIAREADITVNIDGDNIGLFAALCTQRGNFTFKDADSDTIANLKLAANEPFVWASATDNNSIPVSAHANPLTGDVVTKIVSANASTTASTLYVSFNFDATP